MCEILYNFYSCVFISYEICLEFDLDSILYKGLIGVGKYLMSILDHKCFVQSWKKATVELFRCVG